MKIIGRLSLVLSLLFLIVTANESNAAMQSQQENPSISFKQDYLPNNTVNPMDSEQPVLLAKRWGHYKRTHVCFDRINKDIGIHTEVNGAETKEQKKHGKQEAIIGKRWYVTISGRHKLKEDPFVELEKVF